jgi:hypothetical protein
MGIILYLIKADYWTYDKYSNNAKNEIKIYKFKTIEESIKVGQFFLDNGINDYCGCLVAPYDVDFLDYNQCKLLKEWILNNQNIINESHLEEIFKVLYDYCSEAIKLETGIEIEA